jgi:hypothetical protein
MSDIFLSHVIRDADKARKLSALFRGQGWTVWLCSPIAYHGLDFADLDKKMLKGAKAIVALWSLEASASPTVRENLKELSLALPVLVRLDKVAQLPEFLPVRAFDLSDWDGSASNAELQSLLSHLHKLIAPLSPPPASPDVLKELLFGNFSRPQNERAASPPDKKRAGSRPASFEKLSLSEIQENARRAIKESAGSRPKDEIGRAHV